MELVSLTIDGYPCHQYIADKKALILRERAVTAQADRNAAARSLRRKWGVCRFPKFSGENLYIVLKYP